MGEFNGIAQQIQQNALQTDGVTDHITRQMLIQRQLNPDFSPARKVSVESPYSG